VLCQPASADLASLPTPPNCACLHAVDNLMIPTMTISRYRATSEGGLTFNHQITAPAGLIVGDTDRNALLNLGSRRAVALASASDLSDTSLSRLDKLAHQAVLEHLMKAVVDMVDDNSANKCRFDQIGCMTAFFAVQDIALLFRYPTSVLNLVCPGGGCLDFSMLRILNDPARERTALGKLMTTTTFKAHTTSIWTNLNQKSFTTSTEGVFFQGLFPMLTSVNSTLRRIAQAVPQPIKVTSPVFVLGRELAPWVRCLHACMLACLHACMFALVSWFARHAMAGDPLAATGVDGVQPLCTGVSHRGCCGTPWLCLSSDQCQHHLGA